MDLSLASADMQQPSEAIPRGQEKFAWAFRAAVVMGSNPTAAGIPAWWPGEKIPEWPYVLSWFTIYRAAGSPGPGNTRIQIENLRLWIQSRATGAWRLLDDCDLPQGEDRPESRDGPAQPWNAQTRADGLLSLRPANGYWSHGWGVMKDIVVNDIGGIYVEMNHRLILDAESGEETRYRDRWVVSVGADYYPPDKKNPAPYAPGAVVGRYILSQPDFRRSMAHA